MMDYQNNIEVLKRLFNTYTKKHLNKIFLSVFFSVILAGSTASIAWLLDPAIEKIFINKDKTLILVIPILIILAFVAKGGSLYLAKVTMIKVGKFVKEDLQADIVKSLIKNSLTRYKNKFIVIKIPVVSEVVYGRKVGYKFRKVGLSRDLENISATNISKRIIK